MVKASAETIALVKREIAARQFARAERLLSDALARDPNAPELHEQRGLLANAQGDMAGALAALEVAVTLAPDDAEIRFTQLRIIANSDHRDLMGDVAVAAVALAPNDDRVLRLAAKALMKKRDYALAGAYWRRLGERADDLAALVEGARVLVAAREYPGAIACADEALRRDPDCLAAKIQKIRAIERTAPDSAAFAQVVLDAAAQDAWEGLENLPYLLCYDLHETLVGVIAACSRQGVRIDAALVPPVVRAIETFAGGLDDQARNANATRARDAIAYLDACCRVSPDAREDGKRPYAVVGGGT